MTQVHTQYDETVIKPIRISELCHRAFFRVGDTQTVWRILGFMDGRTVRVLNLDDLEVETIVSTEVVTPVEVNSIEIRVELV